MDVQIDDKAIKDLSKIDEKIANNLFSKIKKPEDFPNIANIKKLKNFNPSYRLRINNYRVLFDISDNKLTVYRVLQRKESYK